MFERDDTGKPIIQLNPFASKKLPDGRDLFKRVHGVGATVSANSTLNIDFIIPYAEVKFSGAEIEGCALKDTVDFTVHDTDTNLISGLDVGTYGANFKLNQFGFSVQMRDATYTNTSNYDASLVSGMVLRCTYTNSSNTDRYIGVNYELHEVK